MRIILTISAFVLSVNAYSQSSINITFSGFNNVKLGMTKAEVQKAVGQSIELRPVSVIKDNGYDTITTSLQNIPIRVVFRYDASKDKIVVDELSGNLPGIKTKSGIGIGDNKKRIIDTYEKYQIRIDPDLESKSHSKSTITLRGSEDAIIIFILSSDKVESISVKTDLLVRAN